MEGETYEGNRGRYMSEEGEVENCGNDMRLEGLTTINEYPPTSLTILNEKPSFIIQITSSRMDKVDSTRLARCNPFMSCLV
jgi:hypothetical protein